MRFGSTALVALALFAAACGARPEGPAADALYQDLRAIVATRQRVDWVVDRLEVEEAASDVLLSVCQTPPPARGELRAWLDRRIAAEGGPASAQYARNGGDLDALDELLTLERVRLALDYGERRAAADCPFWLRPDPGFAGVQSDANRFVLLVESMGGAQVVIEDGDATLGGVGAGRLLPAYGLGQRVTLGVGVELGVASTFPRDGGGRRLKPVATAAAPILLRVREETLRFDTEVALTARAGRGELSDPRPGGRVTQGVAIAGLRLAGAQPYGGLWLGYEWLPGDTHHRPLHRVLVGTRFGLDWDP